MNSLMCKSCFAGSTAMRKREDQHTSMSLLLLVIFVAFFSHTASAAIYYVDPANAAATDSGQGTTTAPFKTLGVAVQRLAPGDTLLIAGGVYGETIDLRYARQLRVIAAAGIPQTRIESMPGAQVIITGSNVVEGWEPLGNGVFVKRNWTVNSQQVFVNGTPLKQIGGIIFSGYGADPNHPLAALHLSQGGIWPRRVPGDAANLVDNSFYYDLATQVLYIKVPLDTLIGRTVEVSVRPFLILGEELKNVLFQNLRFKHANTTSLNPSGAITLSGSSLDLNNLQVEQVDGAGFDISGDNNIIRNSVANFCGQLGMKVRGKNAALIYNQTSYNNTRGFNKWWEAGGAKFVGLGGLQDSRVVGHQAYGNNGDGLWFDSQNRNNKIQDSRLAYNKGMGLHYEASAGAQIYKNYVFANRQRGIYLPNSSNSIIYHNLVAYNGLEAIAIIDERQAVEQNLIDLIPIGNYVFGNLIASSTTSLVLPGKGITGNYSNANLFVPPFAWLTFSLGWVTAAQPAIIGLPQWQSATGFDLYSWYQPLPISDQLARDLQLMKLYPDFSAELALAGTYVMPRDSLPAIIGPWVGTHPGPKP